MTKMRVHELAKELGMENKELIDLLHKKNVEVSNHMSSIEDNIADEIRKEKNTRSEGKSEGEEAPKKKNLAFVIRPQNSKNSSRIQGKRPAQKSARPQQSARQNEAKAATTRPASQGARSEKSGAEKSQAARPVPAQTVKAETAAEHSTTEKRPGTQAQSAAEKPQGVRQEKQQPARAEKPVQVQSEKEKRTENDRPARENREARQSNDRPVRENRDGKPVRDGKPSDRQGRFDRGSNDRSRQERPQGNRQFGDGRQSRGGDRDRRPGGQNGRSDREKRESRRDDVAAPIVEQQKSQRNKAKDKERDNKKKEYRDEAFDGKGKKGKKQKQVAEVKRPQPKEEKKEEKIKQIVIPEVLTIKELADKMKIVPSVIVKKLFLQGKVVTVNQEIDYDTAEEIAMEFEVLCEKEEVVDVIEELLKEEEEDENTDNWRECFDVYCDRLREAYESLSNDDEFIAQRQSLHPGIDIRLSLKKAYLDYWSTELGWKKKKSSKSSNIDWKRTFINALDLPSNQVKKARGKVDLKSLTSIRQTNLYSYLEKEAPLILEMPIFPSDEEIEILNRMNRKQLTEIVKKINNDDRLIKFKNSIFETIMEVKKKDYGN